MLTFLEYIVGGAVVLGLMYLAAYLVVDKLLDNLGRYH